MSRFGPDVSDGTKRAVACPNATYYGEPILAVLKPRERIVYFRLSEDEFQHFESACKEVGARSLSDLARNAIKRLIAEVGERHQEQDVAVAVRSLEELMADLQRKVESLIDSNEMKRIAESPEGQAAAPPNRPVANP